jgi:hypothetical protein
MLTSTVHAHRRFVQTTHEERKIIICIVMWWLRDNPTTTHKIFEIFHYYILRFFSLRKTFEAK